MHSKSLFLFPDTNLFLECHTLKNIDWSILGDYDEINLLLSKPVLDEIDLHKKGTGRRRRQATVVFDLAREIVRQKDRNYLKIKDNPAINLYLCTDNYYRHFSKPSLDLTKPDDLLAACVGGYQQQFPDHTVKLITHDIGPMTTCRNHNIDFVEIPESWLKQSEKSEEQKENERLRKEISRLRNKEPEFTITAQLNNEDVERIHLIHYEYSALTEDEIRDCLVDLRNRHPVKRYYNTSILDMNLLQPYQPTEQQVTEYRKDYNRWVENCKSKLGKANLLLRAWVPRLRFHVAIDNVGNAPGEDVLVTLEARGNFLITPPEERPPRLPETISFPKPPAPPVFSIHPKGVSFDIADLQTSIENLMWNDEIIQKSKDTFYPLRDSAGKQISFECELLKQTRGKQTIGCDLVLELEHLEELKGAIAVTVAATNSSSTTTQTIPVTITPGTLNTLHEVTKAILKIEQET